jgi:hypothetical protein
MTRYGDRVIGGTHSASMNAELLHRHLRPCDAVGDLLKSDVPGFLSMLNGENPQSSVEPRRCLSI